MFGRCSASSIFAENRGRPEACRNRLILNKSAAGQPRFPFPLPRRGSPLHLQRGDERLLRDVHLAELAHALLALLLLVQEFALPRDVAAVALSRHVLPERRDRQDRKSTRPELQSQSNLVCRLLLEKKKQKHT